MYQYNDYELLYLISENDEIALDIMFQKYIPLIKSRIKSFKIKHWNQEDFFQEGLIALNKAIQTYREDKNKSFTKYFDLILQRKFMQILRKESKNFYNVTLVGAGEYLEENVFVYNNETIEEIEDVKLSNFEKQVWEYLSRGLKSREVAKELNCTVKQIYDATDRIKKKIKGVKNSLDKK